jgi:hypothetical protein
LVDFAEVSGLGVDEYAAYDEPIVYFVQGDYAFFDGVCDGFCYCGLGGAKNFTRIRHVFNGNFGHD